MAHAICPLCGDDSSIEKVSGIYRAQRATELRRLLAPPSAVPERGWFYAARDIFMALGMIAGFGIAALGAAASGGKGGGEIFMFPTGLIVGGLVGRGLGILVEKGAIEEARRQRRDQYESAMKRWEQSWYCRKHDVVFFEGDTSTYPPPEFQKHLQ